MNTKRVTTMSHKRLAARKAEKDKQKDSVMQAAFVAAWATADALKMQQEHTYVLDRNTLDRLVELSKGQCLSSGKFLAGGAARNAHLKKQGYKFDKFTVDCIVNEVNDVLTIKDYEIFEASIPKGRKRIISEMRQLYKRLPKTEPVQFVVMHEVPKMSVEKSRAISRRMFARTAEEMAQELYDDAE